MPTLHLVSHTHWDREWYRTFQQFRLRLVYLVDGLLDLLERDPDYAHFMLDGQTIVLDDYLHMRPDAEPRLREQIATGRILIGPWHILPDMFLVSPEAHIRNLLAGKRECARFNSRMLIGYMPDSFGHIGQMPQILHGFGIDNACLWRGLDDQPAELWWQSPDGTRLLLLYLRDSYSNGASLIASDAGQFTDGIGKAAASLAASSAAQDLLIMYGTDHMEPPPETSSAIRSANAAIEPDCLLHSTLPAYLEAIQRTITQQNLELPTVQGELRSSKRSHLLPGVLSTRLWIKQRNHACENLLEKWAEPFSSFAALLGAGAANRPAMKRPESILQQAWQLLMECHPHDSICGCSIDQVHDEMRVRFDQVDQIGEEITLGSLESIAAQVHTSSPAVQSLGARAAVVVFNPSTQPRTDLVTTGLTLPVGMHDFELVDEAGDVIPHQSTSGKTADLIHVRVRRDKLGGMLAMVNNGRAGNLAIQDLHFERNGDEVRLEAIFAEDGDPRMDVWERGLEQFKQVLEDESIETCLIHARLPDSARVTFVAPGVPGLGWKAIYVRPKEVTPLEIQISPLMQLLAPLVKLPAAQGLLANLSKPKSRPPYIIENEFFSVELEPGWTLRLTDKRTGQVIEGLNRFVDSGDCGDEYNFSPPLNDSLQSSGIPDGVTVTHGPVQDILTARLAFPVPEALSADRKSRSKKMALLPITTTVRLAKGVARVDIHTRVENCARDHRLRVHFPFPAGKVNAGQYDGHFEIVTRSVDLTADPSWIEQPRPEMHQRAFTSITNGDITWAIANRGLPEVEVIPASNGMARPEIALTLLRCVGWLSRDDFITRQGHAGPFLETPGAQMPGTWEFDYSIIAEKDRFRAYQRAWDFDVPLRAAASDVQDGTLAACQSMIQVDQPAFAITAVKHAEAGDGWIVRGCNYADEELTVKLRPWRRFAVVQRSNMEERPEEELPVDTEGALSFTARGHEVVTIRLGE